MKKFLSLILALCVCLTAFTVMSVSAAEEAVVITNVSEKYVRNTNFLKALGLGDYTEKNPSDNITREEFAGILAKLINEEQKFDFEIVPMDLNTESEYYNAVSAMYAYGIMNGVSSTQFNSKGNITVYQATKCIISVLGYNSAIGQNGYPDEYIKIGQRLKLFVGVPMVDQPMTWENAINLVINSLDAAVVELAGVSNDKIIYSTENKQTILNVYHDIYKSEGRVTDNGMTTISGEKCHNRDGMVIGNFKGIIEDDSLRNLIGQNVEFYYSTEEGIDRILYAELKYNTSDTLVIKADELVNDSTSFTKTNIVYKTGSKNLNAKLDPLADAIYNGKSFPTFMSQDLKITSGQLTLTDTDSDGVYDLVIIDEYVDILINAVDTKNKCIYDYFGTAYSFDKEKDFVTIYDSSMNPIDESKLLKDNVVSVYKSKDGEVVKFVHSTASLIGDVTGIMTDENGKQFITINDVEYVFSDSLLKKIEEGYTGIYTAQLGTNVKVYLNFENKIVDSNLTKNEYMYAFCMKIGEEKVNFQRKTAVLRVFTQTGDEAILRVADKVRINQGEKTDAINVLSHADFYDYDGNFVPQLIKVKVNSKGEVTWLETAVTESTAPLRFEEGKFTLNYEKVGAYNDGNNSYSGLYRTNNNSVVFQIAMGKDGTEAKDISIVRNGPYNAEVKMYDANELWECAAAVVWNNSTTKYMDYHCLLVTQSRMTKNQDDEFVVNLEGWYAGAFWSFIEVEAGLIESIIPEGVKRGDVLLIQKDDKSRITDVLKVTSLADKPAPFFKAYRGTYPAVDHGAVYGNVCAKGNDSFTVTTDDGNTVYSQSANSSTSVYFYDVPNGTVELANYLDVPVCGALMNGKYEITNDDMRVLLIRQRRNVQDIIIVKYN